MLTGIQTRLVNSAIDASPQENWAFNTARRATFIAKVRGTSFVMRPMDPGNAEIEKYAPDRTGRISPKRFANATPYLNAIKKLAVAFVSARKKSIAATSPIRRPPHARGPSERPAPKSHLDEPSTTTARVTPLMSS